MYFYKQKPILKYYLAFIIVIFIFSCDEKIKENKPKEKEKPLLSIVKEYSSITAIKPSYKKDVEDWKELDAVSNFLGRFKKVSANEVLSNAFELQELVESLKDSVKPSLFDNASFNARINVFYNETLRLTDMVAIPAIRADEIHLQIEKTIDAFSSINAKINTVLSKKRFEEAVDVDVKFIGLDTTKIDSFTRKTMNKKVQKLGNLRKDKKK